MKITEAGTVQFPMVRHAEEIGWKPVAPPEALWRRGGEAGGVFRREVESAVLRLNPWMTEAGAALHASMEGNRELLAWLRGERQWYDEAEERSRRVRLADLDNPASNALHATWEWRIKPPARKGARADVVFLLNGLPVAIVEHKNPKDRDAIEKGITQIRRYERETPELLAAAQLFNVTHLLDYWYGVTWNASRRFMARWKERPEDTYRFAVQSFFEPTEFLRTLRDWILFYVVDGETRKTVLRQHGAAALDRISEEAFTSAFFGTNVDTASARCIHRTAVGNQTFAAREAPAVPAQGALSPVRVPILGIMWRPSLSSFPVGGSFRLQRAAQR